MSDHDSRQRRQGVALTAAAFFIWGLFPLYWHLLNAVPSMLIIAHRIIWSTLLVVGGLLLTSRLDWLRRIAAQPGALRMLALSGLAIGFNWGLYIWAVNAGHVIESSLGYYINPLVSVLLGVLILKERLRPMQWLAVGCAGIGVAWLTWSAGSVPWIALGLALSFGLYGLLRKIVAVDAVAGLGVESAYLFLPALGFALWSEHGHGGGFMQGWSLRDDLLLVCGGLVTAVPLIAFAAGVKRIPLSLVGILQYLTPTMQLMLGVWFFHERFDGARIAGFVAIWIGLLVFLGESLWRSRRPAPAA